MGKERESGERKRRRGSLGQRWTTWETLPETGSDPRGVTGDYNHLKDTDRRRVQPGTQGTSVAGIDGPRQEVSTPRPFVQTLSGVKGNTGTTTDVRDSTHRWLDVRCRVQRQWNRSDRPGLGRGGTDPV